jgi:hypothetical protein
MRRNDLKPLVLAEGLVLPSTACGKQAAPYARPVVAPDCAMLTSAIAASS